jgi:hypothetical protein
MDNSKNQKIQKKLVDIIHDIETNKNKKSDNNDAIRLGLLAATTLTDKPSIIARLLNLLNQIEDN